MQAIESVATVLVEVVIASIPAGWERGPLPISYLDGRGTTVVTDAGARATYFHPRACATLYGGDTDHRRWHRWADDDASLGTCRLLATELIRIPTFVQPDRAFLVFHVDLGPDPIATIPSLRFLTEPSLLAAAPGLALGTPDAGDVAATTKSTSMTAVAAPPVRADLSRRATVVSYTCFPSGPPPGPFDPEFFGGWAPDEQWLRVLASATPPGAFQPDPELDRERPLTMSLSWRGMVLRDGAAFLAVRPPTSDGFIAGPMPAVFTRTIYTDAILLGLMQKLTLQHLVEQLAQRDPASGPARTSSGPSLREIEIALDRFRTSLWWQNITHHALANDILIAFQSQHRLPQLLQQIIADLTDSARLDSVIAAEEASAQRELVARQGERTTAALNAITAIRLPAGAVIGLAPIWLEHGVAAALIALVMATALAALALTVLHRRAPQEHR